MIESFSKNARIVIALIISIITTLFIPGTILVAAATAYGTIVSMIIFGLPIAFGVVLFFWFKDNHWARFILLVLLLISMHFMNYYLDTLAVSAGVNSQFYQETIVQVKGYLFSYWVFIPMWILAIISLFSAISNHGGSSEHHPNGFRKFFTNMASKIPQSEEAVKLREAKREETRLLSDLAVEKEGVEKLKAAHEAADKYDDRFMEIVNDNKISSRNHLESFDTTYRSLESVFDAAYGSQRRWKAAQRRETREMRRLLSEMRKKQVSEEIITELEEKERIILGMYSEVNTNVGKAKSSLSKIRSAHNLFVRAASSAYKGGDNSSPIPNLNNTPQLWKPLQAMVNEIKALIDSLKVAYEKEELAMNETIKISDIIKNEWKLA